MKKIKFLFFTLLFCFSVPVKADTAFENDDTVLCSFLKENVPENASPIESSLENEYRKTSSKPIDFYFFKRSEKTKSFQDLYAANVLTYQEKSDRSLLYQTVFDFQNITQVRTAKEDFIRLIQSRLCQNITPVIFVDIAQTFFVDVDSVVDITGNSAAADREQRHQLNPAHID